MRRVNSKGSLRQRRWGRHVAVTVLTIAVGVGVVSAHVATQRVSIAVPHDSSSVSALNTSNATLPGATIVQAAAHLGQYVTAHRPTIAATAVPFLLPLLLLARPRRPIPVVGTSRRYRHGPPLRRGPPTFLAR